jgi:ABC-2 type transport system permease protein
MYNVWTIARREYKAYFASPVAYIVAFLILAVVGGLFTASIFFTMQAMGQVPPPGVQVVTGTLMFLLVFACPALTMRLLSEEQRLGTMELLLTAPVRDWELVVGKWFGSFLFVLTIIALTLIYPVVLNALVDPGIDQGPLLSGYLGVVLVSGAFLAIGVAVSSLFSNQVASFLTTFGILLFFWWIFAILAQVSGPTAGVLLGYLDISSHFYNNLVQGLVELGDLVYLLSVTALALFLGSMSIEMRRWR